MGNETRQAERQGALAATRRPADEHEGPLRHAQRDFVQGQRTTIPHREMLDVDHVFKTVSRSKGSNLRAIQ